jgi:hypothetical protein
VIGGRKTILHVVTVATPEGSIESLLAPNTGNDASYITSCSSERSRVTAFLLPLFVTNTNHDDLDELDDNDLLCLQPQFQISLALKDEGSISTAVGDFPDPSLNFCDTSDSWPSGSDNPLVVLPVIQVLFDGASP